MILFGGTFDPVHEGHLYWAERIRDAAGVDCVYLVPSASPPHRASPGASASQRVAMLNLACADRIGLCVDECELQRSEASFTVQTLRAKRAQQPQEKLAWVVGQDSYNDLYNWREPDAIFALAVLIVMLRPGCAAPLHPLLLQRWQQQRKLTPAHWQLAQAGDVLVVDGDVSALSATAIRAALRAGETAPIGLPPAVANYINEQHLYQS